VEYTKESQLPDGIHRESQLPGGEYIGESITNMNNSTNIRLISKSFLGISIRTREKLFDEKN
jgi:hypothetical protein